MKNLVIFHMESLSNFIFWQNQLCFPNLQKWINYFEIYDNYYSTATSTLMVISDLFFGTTDQFEKSEYLEDIFSISCNHESLFDVLWKCGYKTVGCYMGYPQEEAETAVLLNNIINKNGDRWIGDDTKDFMEYFRDVIVDNAQFAMFVEDNSSVITYEGLRYSQKSVNPTGGGYYIEGRYKNIDDLIGNIFAILEEKKQLNNTLILLYGDHGEEYYFHGLHEGYTHAIEPYTSMTHCPLFFFDGFNNKLFRHELLSTIDLFPMILYRLGIEKSIPKRKYAFSRNLFANQSKRADVFNKGYSVTDGVYTLLVTKGGLALYWNTIDPLNEMNLLNFFVFKKGKILYNKKFDNMISSHYRKFMTIDRQNEIKDKFLELTLELQQHLKNMDHLKFQYLPNKINRSGIKIKIQSRYKRKCNNIIQHVKDLSKGKNNIM